MKTLYLHIGTPKTGTTSLQHFCHDNQQKLAEKGYFYPEFDFEYANKGKYRNGLFLEAVYLDDEGKRLKDKEKENFNNGLEELTKLFKIYDNIILSDEGIWTACFSRKRGKRLMHQLQEYALTSGCQIKIIVYLRRQDEYVLSWYNQLVKHSITTKNTLTWDEYINNYDQYINLDYLGCLRKLKNIFGMENIIVKRFDKNYFTGGSLFSDFLDIFGITFEDSFYTKEKRNNLNTRLSENACEIKRIINETTKMNTNETRKFECILREFSPVSEKSYPCSMMSEEESNGLMQLYELSNQKIADRYICDGSPLFSTITCTKEKWKKNNIHMLDDVIRFSCMSALCTMRMAEENSEKIMKLHTALEHPFQTWFKKIFQNPKTS